MGVYIPDMEIPKEPDEMIEIAIFGDGQVVQTGESWRCIENGKCYYTITNPEKFFNAVSVPPHGRLIDADAFERLECDICDGACESLPCDCTNCNSEYRCDFMLDIHSMPTIIPAEEADE